jgi:hypothetical protein
VEKMLPSKKELINIRHIARHAPPPAKKGTSEEDAITIHDYRNIKNRTTPKTSPH